MPSPEVMHDANHPGQIASAGCRVKCKHPSLLQFVLLLGSSYLHLRILAAFVEAKEPRLATVTAHAIAYLIDSTR